MLTRRTTPSRSRLRLTAGISLGLTLLTAGFLAACSDAPSGPTAAPLALQRGRAPAGPAASTHAVTGVLRDHALAQDITVQATIGPNGGSLQIPDAGMTLEVPAGAVSAPTVFTATALAGRAVAYDFGPSGTFPVALTITQDLKGTKGTGRPSAGLSGVYVRDLSTLDRMTGSAQADESEPSKVDNRKGTISFQVSHFSGYMVSWGFR